MPADIDFSEFRELNNYNDKQPLFPYVEIAIGDTVVTDFTDDMSDTVMDLSYRRTAHQDVADVSGDSFTLTLYDDTAIEIESLIYNIILKTTHQAEETIGDPNATDGGGSTVGGTDTANSVDDSDDLDGDIVGNFFRKGIERNILGTPNDGEGTGDETGDDGGTGDSDGGEQGQEEQWAEALEQINNIDISYGWVDSSGNIFLSRSVHGNYHSYSMEFEGASAILTIEGTSLESGELNSPSSSGLNEFSADEFDGVASDVVVNIVDSVHGLKCNSDTIEETEPILDENGNPKSFVRSGETYEEFIKKYLCEEAVSRRSGKVGYKFYVDNGYAYFKPNETPADVEVGVEVKSEAKGSAKTSDIPKINTMGYDRGSKDIDIDGGIEFTDEIEDYDGEDEYGYIKQETSDVILGDNKTDSKKSKLEMFFEGIEKAADQFYKKNTVYKSKCDSTAGKIRKTVNSSGYISQGIYNFMKSVENEKAFPKGSSFSMGAEFTSCSVFEKNKVLYSMSKVNKSCADAVNDGDVKSGDICGFEVDGKQFVMVYVGKDSNNDLLWYSYGGAGKKKNKGVREWKNAKKPRKRSGYGNVRTLVRVNGLNDSFDKSPEGSGTSGSGGTPSTVKITGFYEFYSGQNNSQVISFSPQVEDISAAGGEWLVSDANSIDSIRNEIISLSLKNNKYKKADVLKDGQKRIMGKSSSSLESLSLKATSMWEKNFARQYTADMEIMGDTGVRTGTWIYIDVYTKYGIRHHSSGIYYVEEAEDNISDGSFTTSLQLRRHGTYEQYQQSLDSGEDENTGGDTGGSDDGDFPSVGSAGIDGMIEWAEKIANNDKWIYKSNNATCPLCHPKGQSKPQGWVCTTFCRGAINHGMFKESNKYWKDKDKAGAGGCVGGSGSGDFEAMLKGGGFKKVSGKAARGDIIVRPNQHAMIYRGKNKIIHAAGKAKGILIADVYFSWSSVRLYRYGG